MKKILTIALVALLAASTAFAGLSGKATLELGYNTKDGSYGFKNGKEFSVDLDLASETAEKTGEGDIYAGVKATLALKLADRSATTAAIYGKNSDVGFGAIFSLKEAYVAGQDWKVSITGTQSGPDFATSAIDTVFDDWSYDAFGGQYVDPSTAEYVAKSYSVSVNKAPGVTATYKDWSLALGFEGGKASPFKDSDKDVLDYDKVVKYHEDGDYYTIDGSVDKNNSGTGAPDYFNYHASLITPTINLTEDLTLKAGLVASGVKNATKVFYKKDSSWSTEVPDNYYEDFVINGVDGTLGMSAQYPSKKFYVRGANYDAFGASAEVAYTSEAFSGKVAADFGIKKTVGTDKFVPGLDVAANAVVSAFTVDAYYQYGTEVQFVSAQVKADLNTYEVPITVKVYGQDIANSTDGQKVGGEVAGTLDAFTVTVGGDYKVTTKEFGVSGSVKYAAEKFTAKAELDFAKSLDSNKKLVNQLYASAFVETDVLVPGATLKLAYAPNTAKDSSKKFSYKTTNFLSDTADKGKVTASCTIKF